MNALNSMAKEITKNRKCTENLSHKNVKYKKIIT